MKNKDQILLESIYQKIWNEEHTECECGCSSCKDGKCSECSCEDCDCKGCSCKKEKKVE